MHQSPKCSFIGSSLRYRISSVLYDLSSNVNLLPSHTDIREFKKWRRQKATTTQQIKDLIGWMRKNNRVPRAARFSDVWRSLPNDEVKFSYLRFWRQRDTAAVNLVHSLPLHENHSCQASESALRLFCTTWPIKNNPKKIILRKVLF